MLNNAEYSDALSEWFKSETPKRFWYSWSSHPVVEIAPALQLLFAKFFENQKNYNRALPIYRQLNLGYLEPPLSNQKYLHQGLLQLYVKKFNTLENYYQALNLDPDNVTPFSISEPL